MSLGSERYKALRSMLDYVGEDMTLRRVQNTGSSGYDPSTGTVGSTSNSDVTVRVALVQYSERLVDNNNILRGDRRAIIASVDSNNDTLSQAPKAGDRLIGVGDRVNIIDVREVRAANSATVYVAQVRE
jgi:hypothetical protein